MRNHRTEARAERRRFGFLGFALLVATLSVAALTVGVSQAEAAAFTVNTTDDLNDNACTASHCSLREAILAANANADADTITFNIPGPAPHTIQPGGIGVPVITFPVVIDGTTEPDFLGTPIVELDGTMTGPGSIGLTFRGGASTVRGLVINRFKRQGIALLARGGYLIEGNYIGTDLTGTVARGNGEHGISLVREFFTNSNNAIVGNVISANVGHGIDVGHPDAGTNRIRGNRIGTDVSGTAALGNTLDGIRIAAPNNTIGGAGAGDGNVISGNLGRGILLSGQGNGNGNILQGNFIGTQADGASTLGNGSDGVRILDSADNTIGGTAAGAGNTIAFNGGDGVLVGQAFNDSRWSGNGILSNSIFSNGGLGIDLILDGVTPNDPGDPDPGPNEHQNFPVLATINGNTIEGTLNSKPSTSYRLEFFANGECDPSMHGEGKRFLGTTGVTTDGNGNAGFTFASPTPLPGGQFVSATATDPANSTSEFSQCLVVGQPTVIRISYAAAARTANGVLVRWRTATETQTLGFNVYRGRSGVLKRLNRALIPSTTGGTTRGQAYSFLDRSAPRGKASYRLQAVNLGGSKSWIGSAAAGAR
jgi:CSLREA domain-containing protein